MNTFTFERATDILLPNITVYRKLTDGVHTAYRLVAEDNHVMYDCASDILETDPDTGEEVLVRSYSKEIRCPLAFDFARCPWVAIPEASVPENEAETIKELKSRVPAEEADYLAALNRLGVSADV